MNRKPYAYSLILRGRCKMALGRMLIASGDALARPSEGRPPSARRGPSFVVRFLLNAVWWAMTFFVIGIVGRLMSLPSTRRELIHRAAICFLFCLGNTTYQAWQAALRRGDSSRETKAN